MSDHIEMPRGIKRKFTMSMPGGQLRGVGPRDVPTRLREGWSFTDQGDHADFIEVARASERRFVWAHDLAAFTDAGWSRCVPAPRKRK